MDIQSIYGGAKKTPAMGQANDGDVAPASGFAALLDMVGSQFKATLGLGALDPAVLKSDAEPARAPDARDTKARPERSDDRDAKAKPAKDDSKDDEKQADETAATEDQDAQAADAGAEGQNGASQDAAQAMVAAAADLVAVAPTAAVAPVVAADVPVEAVGETVVTDVETVVTEAVQTDVAVKTAETVVDPKAVAQTDVKTAEKVVAPEAVVKDTARVREAMSAYAPAQETTDIEAPVADAEAKVATAKTDAKDAARVVETRSVAAQEQANHLARLLGQENRIQVQVTTNPAHAAKQTVADVSIYNIYAGYTAADAISLANGQFGTADEGLATQAPAARASENTAQAAVVAAQAAQAPAPGGSSAMANAPTRADAAPANAIQASASSSGASNANNGFSAFTQSGASNTAQTQAAQQANPTDRPAATAQHVIDQIKVNITKAAKAGLDRVTIQLKPVELGRIEIKLEMSEDHKVRVTVTADNKDTLNLLQTDRNALERTLNDAGLRTDANNLHFNLRSESDAQSADGRNGHGGKNGAGAATDAAGEATEPTYDYAAVAYARGGVDTFA